MGEGEAGRDSYSNRKPRVAYSGTLGKPGHKVAESPWLAEIGKGPCRIKGVLMLWAEG